MFYRRRSRLPIGRVRQGTITPSAHPYAVHSAHHAAVTKRSPSADRRTRRLGYHDPESGECVFFESAVGNEFSFLHHTRQWSHDVVDVDRLQQKIGCCFCCCTCPRHFPTCIVLLRRSRARESITGNGHSLLSCSVFRSAIAALAVIIVISASLVSILSDRSFVPTTTGTHPATRHYQQASSRGVGLTVQTRYNKAQVVSIGDRLGQHSAPKPKQASARNSTSRTRQSVASKPPMQVPPSFSSTCPFRRTHPPEKCNKPNETSLQKTCLVRLEGPRTRKQLLDGAEKPADVGRAIIDRLVPSQVWRSLMKIPGEKLDPAHLTFVPFLTSMQWTNGIYGSVGHIGDIGYGKFTSLLGRVVDTVSGERMFFADLTLDVQPEVAAANKSASAADARTQQRKQPIGMTSPLESIRRRDVIAANVRAATGLDELAADPVRRLFVYNGNLVELSRSLRTTVGKLPQFRVFAIDVHSSKTDLSVLAVEMAVCVLSDGGLIVLDGSREVLDAVVRGFIGRNGNAVVAPLLVVENKLYLTTTNFRRKYYDSIMAAKEWLKVRLGTEIVRDKIGGSDVLRYASQANL